MLMVPAPALIAASTVRQRKSCSVRVASSALHCTSSVQLRARATEAATASSTADGSICSLCFICTGLVEMKVWIRHRFEVAVRGNGEARLDDVDTHFVEKCGDFDLLFVGHGRAGRLLAIAQCGVEDQYTVQFDRIDLVVISRYHIPKVLPFAHFAWF